MIWILDVAMLAAALAALFVPLSSWEVFTPLAIGLAYGIARATPAVIDLLSVRADGEPEALGDASLLDREIGR